MILKQTLFTKCIFMYIRYTYQNIFLQILSVCLFQLVSGTAEQILQDFHWQVADDVLYILYSYFFRLTLPCGVTRRWLY